MLEIKDLHANINGKEILKGINLTICDGEVHALMGQNGTGKRTLSNVLVGHPSYEVTRGSVIFNGKDLLAMSPEDRAHEGVFLSFQAPVEIPGVSMVNFMRAAVNEQRKYRHLPILSASEFLKLMREKRAIVELDNKLASRSVNEGFSGGFAHGYGKLWISPCIRPDFARRAGVPLQHKPSAWRAWHSPACSSAACLSLHAQ